MTSRTDAKVVIGGKVLTLSGYESEEYLQKIASYLNNKIDDYEKMDSFRRQSSDTQAILLQLNVADDLKHELVSAQMKLDSSEQKNVQLQQSLDESTKKIIRLEAELKPEKTVL